MQIWEFSDNWEYRLIRCMTGLAKALMMEIVKTEGDQTTKKFYKDEIEKEKYIGDKKLKKLNPEYMMEIVKTEGDDTAKKFIKMK